MMNISIDTTKPDIYTIEVNSDSYIESEPIPLLMVIDNAVHSHINDVKNVHVKPGPGTRFTKTRCGVAVANAIGFALEIPINNKSFETPIYNKEPNIT